MAKTNGKSNKNTESKTKKYEVVESKAKKGKKNKKEKSDEKGKKKFKIFKKIILGLFLLGIIACLVVAGIVAGIFFSDEFKLTEEDLKITNMNGEVKDDNGNTIAVLSGDENRKIVTFDEMSKYLPDAFIAIEDKRFYEHNGVDIKRTSYVTIMYLFNRGDSDSGGGSTITQQLIKNMMDDKADTGVEGIERKIREMARAYNVEKILSKDQILELYLNKIFMGSTVYGVGMASEYYFNKPASELDLAESAFLAGINHMPNTYNPFDESLQNGDRIKSRTKEVLFQMKDQGKISEEEYTAAVEKVESGLTFSKGTITSKVSYSYHTAAAINQVVSELAKEKGIDKDTAELMVYNNGYTIYTTQNTSIQTRMEEEYVKDKYIKSGKAKKSDGELLNNHTQSAMVIIDHKTGYVVGTVGGLGTDSNAVGINRATQAVKQTGSSIKPIGVVAPAIEAGVITAGTVYDDSETTFSGNYSPHNSGGFAGLMTMRTALEKSSNIVHVKIMAELGAANSIKFLSKMGIEVDKIHEGLSLALGTADVSVLDMAAAYAAIANNGVYIEPTFYTKVEDSNRNVILESKQESERVMSEGNAYVMQSLLKSPVNSGTATVCAMSNMDVGAKTGSTDDYVDRWLCGFTPYYTAATWFGFDYSEKPVFSTNNAANIWAAVMKDIHSSLPTARFSKTSNIVSATICQDSGCVATDSCTRTISEVFVKGTVPGKCEGHTKLKICTETGKIATEYCTNTEEKTYLVKPGKENTKLWSTKDGNKYNIPTETCNVHTAPAVEEVTMINVLGKTESKAKTELEKLGLVVGVKYKEDTSKSNGVVLEQSVSANSKVEKGSKVTITVNKIESSNTNEQNNTISNNVTNNENTTNTNEIMTNET